jgi:hypothetical protein
MAGQTVKSVTAGDSSIQIGGTDKNPTVAVAANGITNAKVGDGALSPAKITGTAATLGSNDLTGPQTITAAADNSALVTVKQTTLGGGTAIEAFTSAVRRTGYFCPVPG